MRAHPRRQHGVSLVEALVALAIMAFGMLGLVGMQASMRANADLAKQRSEAVRLAQEQMENWRGYGNLAQYNTIATQASTAITALSHSNATYAWEAVVTNQGNAAAALPPLKTAVLSVKWQDRTGTDQAVTLMTHIAGVEPLLGASLAAPAAGTPFRQPLGRNAAIPRDAVDHGDGTSRYTPPGLSPQGWVFSNSTGFIIKLCDATFTTCSNTNLMLLSGYVRFADGAVQPTSADSEDPVNGTPFALGVVVDATAPTVQTVQCAVTPPGSYVTYYCPMPLPTSAPFRWSGASRIDPSSIPIALDNTVVDPDHVRICRYTPTSVTGNAAHPAVYTNVDAALTNQNFLVIRAGDGTNAFTCPGDDTSTPYIDGTTVQHQPAPAP